MKKLCKSATAKKAPELHVQLHDDNFLQSNLKLHNVTAINVYLMLNMNILSKQVLQNKLRITLFYYIDHYISARVSTL